VIDVAETVLDGIVVVPRSTAVPPTNPVPEIVIA